MVAQWPGKLDSTTPDWTTSDVGDAYVFIYLNIYSWRFTVAVKASMGRSDGETENNGAGQMYVVVGEMAPDGDIHSYCHGNHLPSSVRIKWESRLGIPHR